MTTPKIMQITPCAAGWQYVETMPNGRTESRPVAAWALLDSGEVVGLLPHKFGPTLDMPARGANARFVPPQSEPDT